MDIQYSNALQAIGKSNEAISPFIQQSLDQLKTFIEDVKTGNKPAFSITATDDELSAITPIAQHLRENFDHIILCGMGGSSLCGKMLAGFASPADVHPPKLHILDNSCPHTIDALTHLPLDKTAVIATSKSGSTIETMTQLTLLTEAMQAQKVDVKSHVYGLTENNPNPLRTYLESFNCSVLNHNPHIGGRWSVFSNVGMLPALIMGLDAAKLRAGGAGVLQSFLEVPENHPATHGAALNVLAQKEGCNQQVIMPYGNPLRLIASWVVQLWAESLGKNGTGTSPIAAAGATDQHATLQMYMDGPNDKLFTIIQPDTRNHGTPIKDAAQPHLNGLTAGTLLYYQCQGTTDALQAAGRPVRTITMAKVNEETLGGLLMHFMLETVSAGAMWQIDAFNQPAVEDSKKRTMAYLNKVMDSAA